MGFKGIYANKSSTSKVGILFLLIFLSLILHTLIAVALVALFSDNGMALIQNQDLSNQASVNYLKLMQLFSGVGLFITPTLLYAYLTNFDFKFFKLSRQNAILVIAIMMLITPFIGLLLEWNMMISFPEWLLQFDVNSEAIVIAFLQMDTIWDLFYTILVIAVVPAIGEELLFRGYLQQKLSNWLSNPHTAILITAFLFSAIHFHFQGMIPRFVLGVLLGYLFYWSNSLWLPILAHFVNNAQAVIFSCPLFKVDSGTYSMFSETKVDPMIALFSLASVVLLLYILHQNISIKKADKISL
jgi:hypothetical protein